VLSVLQLYFLNTQKYWITSTPVHLYLCTVKCTKLPGAWKTSIQINCKQSIWLDHTTYANHPSWPPTEPQVSMLHLYNVSWIDTGLSETIKKC